MSPFYNFLRLWTVEAMTQYQCGVDPSEENSGVTSSDEDVPEEAKEAILQITDPDAALIGIGTNDLLYEASKIDTQVPSVIVAAPDTNTRLR